MSKNVYKGEKVCLTKEKMAGIHTHTHTHTHTDTTHPFLEIYL